MVAEGDRITLRNWKFRQSDSYHVALIHCFVLPIPQLELKLLFLEKSVECCDTATSALDEVYWSID